MQLATRLPDASSVHSHHCSSIVRSTPMELNPLYEILESSFNFWLQPPPPLTLLDAAAFFTPQTCNKKSDAITTAHPPPPPPPPPLSRSHPNAAAIDVPQNLNSNADVEQPNSGKRSGRDQPKNKEKETWYKGPWTIHEDRKLINLVNRIGLRKWATVAKHMNRRIGKQCRERWHNNLRPNIRKSLVWSDEEEMLIMEGHLRFGNRWSEIAKQIPGRSENAVKNHWNSIKRRLSSKKRIKRPANLRNLYQSNILENYIKNKFFNTTNSPPQLDQNNAFISTTATNLPLFVDDGGNADNASSTSYFVAETVDEEMSFLRSLFGDINVGN